jgi:hypothetical protein
VPTFIREKPQYREQLRYVETENQWLNYTDWSSPDWLEFHMDFHREFHAKYHGDKRLAYFQVCRLTAFISFAVRFTTSTSLACFQVCMLKVHYLARHQPFAAQT